MLNNAPAAAPKRLVTIKHGSLPHIGYFAYVAGLSTTPEGMAEARATLALMRRVLRSNGPTNELHECLRAHGFAWTGLRLVEPLPFVTAEPELTGPRDDQNTAERDEALLDRTAIAMGVDPARARAVREAAALEEALQLAAEDADAEARQEERREREADQQRACLAWVAGVLP